MEETTDTGFAAVDGSLDPRSFVVYLDGINRLDSIQGYKRRALALLRPQPGQHLLEVGCGTGEDARALAALVGPGGHVVGIDGSATMIAEAQSRTAGQPLPVEFRAGDAHRLPLGEEVFDGCRADRVFQHLADPLAALKEMVRVSRPCARIVVSEPDWETLVVSACDRALARKVLRFHCDSVVNGWIGRQLPVLFRAAGLRGVGVSADTMMFTDSATAEKFLGVKNAAARALRAGALSEDEAVAWLDQLAGADRAGCFFCAITGFAVTGHRP
jgi:SAM-dependent methyltransferase